MMYGLLVERNLVGQILWVGIHSDNIHHLRYHVKMSYNELRKGRFSETGREYFITFVTHNRLDVFNQFLISRCFILELKNSEKQYPCQWLAWVLMPDHFHGLVSLGDDANLSSIIKSLKGTSARRINKILNNSEALWQPGFHDHALRNDEDRIGIARYIVANPLRAGLVKHLGNWPHWDSVYL